FFYAGSPTSELVILSLHDALPISNGATRDRRARGWARRCCAPPRPAPPAARAAAADRPPDAPPGALRSRGASSPIHRASAMNGRSEEHTSELQSLRHLVCRLLLEK